MKTVALYLSLVTYVGAQRVLFNLDLDWRFQRVNASNGFNCSADTFPNDLNDVQCLGLTHIPYADDSASSCRESCCGDDTCLEWQWCPGGDAACGDRASSPSCWTGAATYCVKAQQGWQGQGRDQAPPTPTPSNYCNEEDTPQCGGTDFDDSEWRVLNIPHDFVVEGNFTEDADMSHGYLPYGKAYYRKHFSVPTSVADSSLSIHFEGVMVTCEVYLNGFFLGTSTDGYIPFSFSLDNSALVIGDDESNVLAVFVDATNPDSWWYDGGGIYRHVWVEAVNPQVHIADYGVYAPSLVTSDIQPQTSDSPAVADALFQVSVELESATSLSKKADIGDNSGNSVELTLFSSDGSQSLVQKSIPFETLEPGTSMTLQTNFTLFSARLWSVEFPTLYKLQTVVLSNSVEVDVVNTTLGVRKLNFDSDKGFYLNDVPVKIKGCANHQDFAGLGVAIPDKLQSFRIKKLQELGSNAWRTAHNAPTKALLDYADELGMLVWNENHRNGEFNSAETLVKRDRNHPSVVIWSICNEVLCDAGDGVNSQNSLAAAAQIKSIYEQQDPFGQRPVSANQNEWINNRTVLDLLGYDYATESYDLFHYATPTFPAISSETSSAVSDRGEYVNNETSGHVTGYDTEAPSWGQTAEQAWGGINEPNGQGILTRDFVSGGFVWTGFDYKGEPTPYSWPDINSHFGILDIAGFEKDRAYWYRSWWSPNPDTPTLHVFPHWNWEEEGEEELAAPLVGHSDKSHRVPCSGMCMFVNGVATVDVWVFSEADQVELLVNGESQGKQVMPQYSHVSWSVQYASGSIEAIAYNSNSEEVARETIVTTGEPYALKASIKDGVGEEGLSDDGSDVALVQVQVVDSDGNVVPTASNDISFTIDKASSAFVAGTGNGDPSDHTNDKSPSRPAYHGLVLGIIQALNGDVSEVVVQVASDGLVSDSITLQIVPSSFPIQRL